MSDIFLSYAREDRKRVGPVIDALQNNGWSVFWDPTIIPGQAWDHVIQGELDTARCVVVLWSRNSVRSEWVRIEAHSGKRRGILIPALLDDVTDSIPVAFSLTQAANLVGWSGELPHAGFQQLAHAIGRHVPPPTVNPKDGRPYVPREALPLNFRNAAAVRIAFVVAAISTLVFFVLPFLNWVFSGFFAVLFYRRRTSSLLNLGAGIRMGWITGVLAFALYIVPFALQLPRMISLTEERLRALPPQDPAFIGQMIGFFTSSWPPCS